MPFLSLVPWYWFQKKYPEIRLEKLVPTNRFSECVAHAECPNIQTPLKKPFMDQISLRCYKQNRKYQEMLWTIINEVKQQAISELQQGAMSGAKRPEAAKGRRTVRRFFIKMIVSGGSAPAPPLPVGLKASEKSAFRPPQGCVLRSLWENIINEFQVSKIWRFQSSKDLKFQRCEDLKVSKI